MRISDSQIALVNGRIDALLAADNFYGKKLRAAGVTSVSTADDFEALPFSEKGRASNSSGVETEVMPAALSFLP